MGNCPATEYWPRARRRAGTRPASATGPERAPRASTTRSNAGVRAPPFSASAARLPESASTPVISREGSQTTAGFKRRLIEHMKERGAVYGDAEARLLQRAVAHVKNDPPGRNDASVEAVDALAEGEDPAEDAEGVENGQTGRLENEPRADGRRRRETIEGGDAMSGTGEQGSDGEPRNPTSCNRDVEALRHPPSRGARRVTITRRASASPARMRCGPRTSIETPPSPSPTAAFPRDEAVLAAIDRRPGHRHGLRQGARDPSLGCRRAHKAGSMAPARSRSAGGSATRW